MAEATMNKKRYRNWQLDDPEVQQIFDGAIRSSRRSFYKIVDGRHPSAPLKSQLIELPMTAASAPRLLEAYPFPEAPFIKNRKRDANLTEEELAAMRERQAIRKAKAAAKAKTKSEIMEPIQVGDSLLPTLPESSPTVDAIDESPEESPSEELELSVNEETERCKRPSKSDPEELMENKNHCLIKRGEWWGIYHSRDATVHLISKDRSEAVEVLARYGRIKECYQWSKN
jgi:hypothetical protein